MRARAVPACAFLAPRPALLASLPALLLFMGAPAQANEFPSEINLGALGGAGGSLFGIFPVLGLGHSVAGIGDFNGDGFDDFIVGSRDSTSVAGQTPGTAYVIMGRAGGFVGGVDSSAIASGDTFKITGVFGEDDAATVAPAGDIDGDGFDDIIISGDEASSDRGTAYVIFGRDGESFAEVNVSEIELPDGFRIVGEAAGDDAGVDLHAAGDINDDGFDDLLIGAPGNSGEAGRAYVVFGKKSFNDEIVALANLDGTNGFKITGTSAEALNGYSVSPAGDINGDGIDDIVTGAFGAITGTLEMAGAAFVIFGKRKAFPAKLNVTNLNGKNGFRISGEDAFDFTGYDVGAAGDVNGDGVDDLIVSAKSGNENGALSGKVHVVFGRKTAFPSKLNVSALNGSNGFQINGEAGDRFGSSVSGAGDINTDGFADIVIGAQSQGPASGNEPGAAYVIFGKSSPFPAEQTVPALDGTNGFKIVGVENNDNTGFSVAPAGDFDHDGFHDFLVGADRFGTGNAITGAAHIIYGAMPDAPANRTGSAADQYISGGDSADTLNGAGGDDILEGRGGGDALNGGAGDNWASYRFSEGDADVIDLNTPSNNTGAAAGDSYENISNVIGSNNSDVIRGDDGNNKILGLDFQDFLTGEDGNDLIEGGLGNDILIGGGNRDTFRYRSTAESPPGDAEHDRITDFDPGTADTSVDKIDLSRIDAKRGVAGNQAFTFIGNEGFSRKKGELRLKKFGADILVQGDVTGDGVADIEILLEGTLKMSRIGKNDFKL